MGIAGSPMQSICRDWAVALHSMDQVQCRGVLSRVLSSVPLSWTDMG